MTVIIAKNVTIGKKGRAPTQPASIAEKDRKNQVKKKVCSACSLIQLNIFQHNELIGYRFTFVDAKFNISIDLIKNRRFNQFRVF